MAETRPINTYLLNEPDSYWVYQREGSDVFANHRLKCDLTLETYSGRLDLTNLAQRLYTRAMFEFRSGTNVQTLTGSPSSWSNSTHTVSQDSWGGFVVRDTWTTGTDSNQWAFELRSVIYSNSASPFLAQAEIRKFLRVTYPAPQLVLAPWQATITNICTEEVQLVQRPDLLSLCPETPELMTNQTGLSVEVAYLSSTNLTGPPMGVDRHSMGYYPIALSPWTHTRITGLLSSPLELRSYYSQSSAPSHHNLTTWFILEPDLEPGLPVAQVAELAGKNIALIYIKRTIIPDYHMQLFALGFDGQLWQP